MHTIAIESSIAKWVAKRPQKEEIEVEKKEKIFGKIVMGKKAKSFDLVECRIKDTTIGEEYVNSFPFGFSLIKGVNLPINCFKRSAPDVVYHPLYREHVNEIKMRITLYNKFDTKVPIFTILEDP